MPTCGVRRSSPGWRWVKSAAKRSGRWSRWIGHSFRTRPTGRSTTVCLPSSPSCTRRKDACSPSSTGCTERRRSIHRRGQLLHGLHAGGPLAQTPNEDEDVPKDHQRTARPKLYPRNMSDPERRRCVDSQHEGDRVDQHEADHRPGESPEREGARDAVSRLPLERVGDGDEEVEDVGERSSSTPTSSQGIAGSRRRAGVATLSWRASGSVRQCRRTSQVKCSDDPGQTLEGNRLGLGLEAAADLVPGSGVYQHFTGRRFCAQSRCEIYDRSKGRVVGTSLEADDRQGGVAVREANAVAEVVASVRPSGRESGQGLPQLEGHSYRRAGRVVTRNWVIEISHDPVSGEHADRGVVALKYVSSDREVLVQCLYELLWFGVARERGESAKIAEQHGDLAAMRPE